jgi:hypothetical protein
LGHVRRGKKGTEQADIFYWTKLVDEHIKKFGLQENYKELLAIQIELAQAQLDYVATGNKKLKNTVRRLEAKITKMLVNNGENIDVNDVLIYLSKFLGYKIDKFTLTVTEYFKMINIYTKANANTNKEK